MATNATVSGPVFEFKGPKFDDIKAKAREGDLQATVLFCSEILYDTLAKFDVRLERLEKHLKIIDE